MKIYGVNVHYGHSKNATDYFANVEVWARKPLLTDAKVRRAIREQTDVKKRINSIEWFCYSEETV